MSNIRFSKNTNLIIIVAKAYKMSNFVPFIVYYIALFFKNIYFLILLTNLSAIFVQFQIFLIIKTLSSQAVSNVQLLFWPLLLFYAFSIHPLLGSTFIIIQAMSQGSTFSLMFQHAYMHN